jgi:hypothetical protein
MILKLLKVKTVIFLILFCASINVPTTSFIKDKTVFIDAEVAHSELLRKNVTNLHNTIFNLFSHGRSGELLINGEWKNAEEIVNSIDTEFSI